MESLLDLGKKHGTDKVVHAYIPHYAERFENQRNDPKFPAVLLEIGVMDGASLRMWRDYFATKVYGIDIVKESIINDRNIQCFLGDQADHRFLAEVVDEIGPLDIVIDDGSHRGWHHVASFEFLWQHVKPGGWYCIEDCFSIFEECWTGLGDRTILQVIEGQWKDIIRSSSSIAEVTVIGCDTQKVDGRNNGLIFFRKAHKEQ